MEVIKVCLFVLVVATVFFCVCIIKLGATSEWNINKVIHEYLVLAKDEQLQIIRSLMQRDVMNLLSDAAQYVLEGQTV